MRTLPRNSSPRVRAGLAAGAVFAGGSAVLFLGIAHAATGATDCSSAYAAYSGAASASGVLVEETPAGLLPVDSADGGMPDAQARIGSLSGSSGFAGVPYSDAAAGNLGLTPVAANDVPVFVVAKYPTEQSEKKDTGTASLSATAQVEAATGGVVGNSSVPAPATAGRFETSTSATCGSDTSVGAVADSTVDAFAVAGVLRIASVHSHAQASVDTGGKTTLNGAMQIEGATVLGQSVSITDQGVVAGGQTTPLPDASPVTSALKQAGVEVHYVEAVKDPKNGTVTAPGLQITVTQAPPPTVGNGNTVTTYTLGRALATVSNTGDGGGLISEPAPAPLPTSFGGAPPPASVPSSGGSVAAPAAPTTGGPAPVVAPSTPAAAARPNLANAAFGRWSITPAYVALGIGALVLMASTIGLRKVTARLT